MSLPDAPLIRSVELACTMLEQASTALSLGARDVLRDGLAEVVRDSPVKHSTPMKPAADDICELLRLMLWDAAASYVCAADHPQQAPRVYLLGVFDAYCRALSAAGDHETPFEITLVGI